MLNMLAIKQHSPPAIIGNTIFDEPTALKFTYRIYAKPKFHYRKKNLLKWNFTEFSKMLLFSQNLTMYPFFGEQISIQNEKENANNG